MYYIGEVMKTLLLTLTIVIGILNCKAQLNTYNYSYSLNVKQEVKKRTIQAVIVQTALFIAADYYMRTNNKQAYDKCAYAFIGVTFTSYIYIQSPKWKNDRNSSYIKKKHRKYF